MILHRAFLLLLLAWPIAAGEETGSAREWTSTDGRKISGSMLGTEGGAVAIKLSGSGKTSKVPLSRLSEADRDFVAKRGWALPKPWKKWPGDIKINLDEIEVETVSTGSKPIYRTRHFEIHSEDELGQLVVKDIARVFEGTYRLLEASPWGMLARPKGGHFRAELYRNRERYIRAGGPTNSAGVYMPARKVFMVPFESLGLKEMSSGWQRTSEYTTKTLIHELTHMMMDDALQTLPMWLIEGAAEYMELMPMRIGAFSPEGHLSALRKHNAQEPAFSLNETFSMDHGTWQNGGKPLRSPGLPPTLRPETAAEIPKLYHAGLLLTYYFIHLDGDGDAARLQRFIAASVRNAERIETYRKDQEAYEKAFQEFIKRPEVQDVGGGNYRFPASLKPPVAPDFPFDCKPEELPFREMALLLDSRDKGELLFQVRTALEKARLSTIGGKAAEGQQER